MKKWSMLLSAVMVFMLIVAGCGNNNNAGGNSGSGSSGDKVELSFSIWGDKEFWEESLKTFESNHPNIKVKLNFMADSYEDKLFTMISGGNAPDVMTMYETTTPDVAKKGVVEDLTPYIEKDNSFDISDFYDVSLELSKIDNKIYGLGYALAPQMLFYNKTMFDKANVAYPTGDWTWDDYLEAAKKLTVKEGDKIVQYGSDSNTNWWIPAEIAVRQNGGDFFKDEKANFDSPEVIEALQFWADITNKHKVAPTLAEMSGQGDLFPSGLVAMTRNGVWLKDTYKDIKDFEWDIAPLPKQKQASTVLHTSYFTMSSKSKHKEEAWELIKWLSGPEVQEGIDSKAGFLPTRKSVSDKEVYDTKMPASTHLIGDTADYGRLLPYAPGVKQATDELQKELEQIFTGKVTAEQAMKAFQAKAQSVIEKNK
ncbi:Putative ABC transporter substrate-binding protein YesO [Paenibacillus plantiphilus]|uniref:ABC transporter substrate-binding protein YesO n=1 Tax=Paenibacillus plantiphilus TaxID=2905650 RepID=A0ABM9CLJ4_9BACL|nr:sugar ABC transporter substrate-binding protein [Paenibacillus plantiphilus]CAH1216299.1 Putative ABC transporter substrate-binding protein YesO [Paenibacillus plantiphilus]